MPSILSILCVYLLLHLTRAPLTSAAQPAFPYADVDWAVALRMVIRNPPQHTERRLIAEEARIFVVCQISLERSLWYETSRSRFWGRG